MSWSVSIGGKDVTTMADNQTFQFSIPLEAVSSSSLTVEDFDGTYRPVVGEKVVLTDENSSNIFAGVVARVIEEEPRYGGTKRYRMTVSSLEFLIKKRVITKTYASKKPSEIITELVTGDPGLFGDEGITEGTVDSDEDAIDTVEWNYTPGDQAMRDLARRAGKIWKINPDLTLDFTDRFSNSAPWDVNSTTLTDRILKFDLLRREDERANYRNRQIVRGIRGVLQEREETFTADEGQGRFNLDYEIEDITSITVNGGSDEKDQAAITLFTDMPGHGNLGATINKWRWSPADDVLYLTDSTLLDAGDTVLVTYQGRGRGTTVVENSDEITDRAGKELGTGIHTKVYNSKADRIAEGKSIGKALLNRFGTLKPKVIYQTLRTDLEVGMLQGQNPPGYDINFQGIIGQINIRPATHIGEYDPSNSEGNLIREVKVWEEHALNPIGQLGDGMQDPQEDRESELVVTGPSPSDSLKEEAGTDEDDVGTQEDTDLEENPVGQSLPQLFWGTGLTSQDLIGMSTDGNFSSQLTVEDACTGGYDAGLANIDGTHVAVINDFSDNIQVVDLESTNDPVEEQFTGISESLSGGIACGDGAGTIWVMGDGTDIHEYTLTETSEETWSIAFQTTYTAEVEGHSGLDAITYQGGQQYTHSNGSPDDYTIMQAGSGWQCDGGWAIMNRTNGHGSVFLGNGFSAFRRDSDADVMRKQDTGNYASCGSNDPFTDTGNTNWDGDNESFVSLPEDMGDFSLI